jgi:protein-tyrosine-phosphatase
MAQQADIVLCMTETHLSVASMLTEKAELLDPLGDIADPIGQSQSVYDALADQLGKIIAQKLDVLTRQGAK